MNNLPKFIQLEKLFKTVGHGKVVLDMQLRDGQIVGITTTGGKKTVYNMSSKDINTNEVALEYILKRLKAQLENNLTKSTVVFKIYSEHDKIRSVEVESEQTI